MCHARTSTRTCFFYTNLEAKKEEPDFKRDVLDIEDLVTLGKKHSACPYFMTKELRKGADIIFMPYNYLLDPKVRKIHNIELHVSAHVSVNDFSSKKLTFLFTGKYYYF